MVPLAEAFPSFNIDRSRFPDPDRSGDRGVCPVPSRAKIQIAHTEKELYWQAGQNLRRRQARRGNGQGQGPPQRGGRGPERGQRKEVRGAFGPAAGYPEGEKRPPEGPVQVARGRIRTNGEGRGKSPSSILPFAALLTALLRRKRP